MAQAAEQGSLNPEETAFFESQVRPLLIERCYECHSHHKPVKGGLTLDSRGGWEAGGDRGPAIVPGKPDESLLIQAVRYQDADLQMPPTGRLSEGPRTGRPRAAGPPPGRGRRAG